MTYNNLRQIKNNLEIEVENRTTELLTINNNLQKEMKARIVAEENLKSIPNYDISTGLFNRQYAKNFLEDLISLFNRHGHTFSIILFEIDNFSFIKETFNKSTSERVLCETIDIIKSLLRRTDLLARWDNDKFLVIMPNCSETSAISVAEKINDYINTNIIEGVGSVTVTLGYSTITEKDVASTILNRTEQNLNESKEQGNNFFPKF